MFSRRTNRTRAQRPIGRRVHLELEALEAREVPYSASGNLWPHPELVTISFMPDGTDLGGATSNLFSTFNARFGSPAVWQNQILKAAQQWAEQTNLNFAVVPDNGAPIGSDVYQQGSAQFGDIRIGGYNFGTATLATAYLPPPVNNYSVAGDMQFNTGSQVAFNIGSTYDLFTVSMHEFGHSLGLYHGAAGSVMQSTYSGVRTGLTADDKAGIKFIYGGSTSAARVLDACDEGANNSSFSSASNVNSFINGTTKAGVVNDLDLTTSTDVDWYKFTVPAGGSSTLRVTVQTTGFSLMAPKVQIYNASQVQKAIANSSATDFDGGSVTAIWNGVAAGKTVYVKVSSSHATTAFKTGCYGLILNMGSGADPSLTPPDTQTHEGDPRQGGGGEALFLGAESLVNDFPDYVQQTTAGERSLATAASGDYVVVWSSYGQDGDGWGVYARLFDKHGVAQGEAFPVNTTTTGDQRAPSVAMDNSGDFVITWAHAPQAGSDWDICGQRFDKHGNAEGDEFRVNSISSCRMVTPATAMDSHGDFVVVWSTKVPDGEGRDIHAQCYDQFGDVTVSEFCVNTTTANDQISPAVAMDNSGNFVVTWSSAGDAEAGWDINAQRFNRQGELVGAEFRVNTTTTDNQTASSVAVNRGRGDCLIAWTSAGQDGDGMGVYAQRYDADGVAVGSEFRVNTTTAGDQRDPSVALDAMSNALIVWASAGQDGGGWGIFGQQFMVTGHHDEEDGGEQQLNVIEAGDQQFPTVAISMGGRGIVAWSGSSAEDHNGIYLRRFSVEKDDLPADVIGVPPPPVQPVDPHKSRRSEAVPSPIRGRQNLQEANDELFAALTGTARRAADIASVLLTALAAPAATGNFAFGIDEPR